MSDNLFDGLAPYFDLWRKVEIQRLKREITWLESLMSPESKARCEKILAEVTEPKDEK